MPEETERSRAARRAAERALVRVVHHYGGRSEFVVLGGLVPELLCAESAFQHAGTTDVDVQVDLEIACGAVQTRRLERALLNAEFEPDGERVWRWRADAPEHGMVIKFELLADLEDQVLGAQLSATLAGSSMSSPRVAGRWSTSRSTSRATSSGSPSPTRAS